MRGKQYKKALKNFKVGKAYSATEAVDLIKKGEYANFKTTFEAKINLNIDPGDNEQNIRFTTSLPHSTGRKKIVLAFTDTEIDSKKYKTLTVIKGDDKAIDQVISNKLVPGKDFTMVVTDPSYMPKIAKIARVLGPKGLMPSPKTETVGEVEKILKNLDGGQIEVRSQPSNRVIHLVLGKTANKTEELTENLKTIIDEVNKHKPTSVKKILIDSVFVKSTMSPSVRVEI